MPRPLLNHVRSRRARAVQLSTWRCLGPPSVLNRTAADSWLGYRAGIQLPKTTVIVAPFSVAAIYVGGIAAGLTSAFAWVSVTALAVLPACSLLVVWNRRAQASPALHVVRR